MDNSVPSVLVLLDNLRFDQWKVIEPILTEAFRLEEEDYFYSILPTSTQYSRNAIFSGMMPSDIDRAHPDWWRNDNEEGGKNLYEDQLFSELVRRTFRKELKFEYLKITSVSNANANGSWKRSICRVSICVPISPFCSRLSSASRLSSSAPAAVAR